MSRRIKLVALMSAALTLFAGIAPALAYHDFELDFDNKPGRAQDVSPKEDDNLPSESDAGLIKAYDRTAIGDRIGKGNSVIDED